MWMTSKQDLLLLAMLAGYGKPEREPAPEEVRAKADQDAYIARLKGQGEALGLPSLSGFGSTKKCNCVCPSCGGKR